MDVLVEDSKFTTAKQVAKHYGLQTVGGIMRHWSVRINLHDKAKEMLQLWGDANYQAICDDHGIETDENCLEKFDESDVVNRGAFYPAIWKKSTQTEDFQCKAMDRILLHFLRSRPVKSLNRTLVSKCLKWVEQADKAMDEVQTILNDSKQCVRSNRITQIDVEQVQDGCSKLLKKLEAGQLDGKLTDGTSYSCPEIQHLYSRLDAIKFVAEERRTRARERKKQASEVNSIM